MGNFLSIFRNCCSARKKISANSNLSPPLLYQLEIKDVKNQRKKCVDGERKANSKKVYDRKSPLKVGVSCYVCVGRDAFDATIRQVPENPSITPSLKISPQTERRFLRTRRFQYLRAYRLKYPKREKKRLKRSAVHSDSSSVDIQIEQHVLPLPPVANAIPLVLPVAPLANANYNVDWVTGPGRGWISTGFPQNRGSHKKGVTYEWIGRILDGR